MNHGEYFKKVGSNMKAIRMAKKISIRQLGFMAEIDYSSLNRFENRGTNIRILTLKKVADALGVEVKDLM